MRDIYKVLLFAPERHGRSPQKSTVSPVVSRAIKVTPGAYGDGLLVILELAHHIMFDHSILTYTLINSKPLDVFEPKLTSWS